MALLAADIMANDPQATVIVVDPQALEAHPTVEQHDQARSATALPMTK